MIDLPLPPKEKIRHPAFLSTVFVRIVACYFFFIDPWIGWTIWVILDILDSIPWRNFAELTAMEYEMVDKYVDDVIFIVMLLVSIKIKYGIFWPLLALLLFRWIGEVLFFKTRNEKYLIYFPNFFEAYWVWSILLVPLNFLNSIYGLALVFSLKIIHELIKHYFGPKYIFPKIDRLIGREVA